MIVTFIIIGIVAWVTMPNLTVRIPKLTRRRERAGRRRRRNMDMGMVLTEVATRLRSGQGTETAWRATLAGYGYTSPEGEVVDDDGVPRVLAELWRAPAWRRRVPKVTIQSLPATFAVCRLSHSSGAPMAQILESCAKGMTESGESRSARDVALAGPITSARMLAALPLVGILLGSIAGIEPIAFFTTPVGRLVLGAGLVFEGVGIYVTWRMVRYAKEAEADE